MLPENIWKRRIESEYEEMKNSGEQFVVNSNKTKYVVTIHAEGLEEVGEEIRRRELHKVEIELLRGFPYPGGIKVKWITPIFHPNIRGIDGAVCIRLLNQWSPMQGVLSVVEGAKQLLEHPNPHDPLDLKAADYFLRKMEKQKEVKKPKIVRVGQ